MEAAGTVVGVVSLGITLCDGIIQYCRAWKHQDDDVRALRESTNGLRNVLQDVERWLQRQPNLDPAIVLTVTKPLQACNDQISKAIGISDKYTTGQTAAKKGKLKNIIQRMKFPFERNVLGELRDIVEAFRGNVNIALNLLNTDITASGLEAIQKLQNDNQNEIISEIRNSATKIANSIMDDLNQKLSAHAHSLTTSIARHIDGSGISLKNTISEPSADVISQFQATPTELVMLNREQKKHIEYTVSNPADILNPLHQIQERASVGAVHLSSPGLFSNSRKKKRHVDEASTTSSHCTCTVKVGVENLDLSSRLKLRLGNIRWSFYKETETFIIHDRHCPMWYSSRKDTMYRFHSRVFEWWMSGSLELKRSPHIGYSGWAVSPSLNFRPVVSNDSPSFRVVSRYINNSLNGCNPGMVEDLLRDLRTVFRSGRGSPWDVTDQGKSLLLYVSQNMIYHDPLAIWQLCRGFLAMGIDIDEESEGESLIRSVQSGTFRVFAHRPETQTQQWMSFLLWCIDRGGQLSWEPFPEIIESLFKLKFVVEALRAYEDLAKAASCGILSLAVLLRDLSRVRAILQQKPHLLEKERNIFGQTPLFLAIGWPNGLELLLQATNDSGLHNICNFKWNGHTLLDCAIAHGCAESMELLATTGLTFSFSWSYYVASAALDPVVSDFLVRLIVERCHQLHTFGLTALPKELIRSNQLENFEIFISNAWLILEYFDRNNIIVPAKFVNADVKAGQHYHYSYLNEYYYATCGYFCPHFGSILHQLGLPLAAAQVFLNEGFDNIDIECQGLTPLMCLNPSRPTNMNEVERFLRFVDFFVEKGARLDKEIPPRYIAGLNFIKNETRHHHRAIHRIASISWHNLFGLGVDIFDVSQTSNALRISKLQSTEVWRGLMASKDSDRCLCACSTDGCRPISLALKSCCRPTPFSSWNSFFEFRNWEQTLQRLSDLAMLLESLTGQYLVNDVVRFLTFSALELTHTCCDHDRWFSILGSNWESEKIIENWSTDGSEIYDSMEDSQGPVMIRLMDPTEIEEIREEEKSMIDRLNLLVEEFMKEVDELAISLPEFLRTRWAERMYAELSKRDEMSEIEQRAIADLGVEILEDDEDGIEEMTGKSPNELGCESRKALFEREYDEWIRSLEKSIK